jgi:hypothetical protein
MKQEFINVNGKAYDPVTGLPLPISVATSPTVAPTQPKRVVKASTARGTTTATIHRVPVQKSATLSRRHIKRPPQKSLATRPVRTPHTAVQQHVAVKKFSPQIAQKPAVEALKKPVQIDRPAEVHPVVQRAKQRQITKAPVAPIQKAEPKPASILKNEAISEALAKAQEPKPDKHHRAKRKQSKLKRWTSLASAGLAIMLLGGYFTYLSMPNISIRVAALQSGINATYPGYKPNGYALNGPISFKQGEVSMKFAYADGTANYTISQSKSNWDSAAVKEYISGKSGAPATTIVDGLTIFAAGENVAWVNGGILYQINSHSPLSSEQIRKIATSM